MTKKECDLQVGRAKNISEVGRYDLTQEWQMITPRLKPPVILKIN